MGCRPQKCVPLARDYCQCAQVLLNRLFEVVGPRTCLAISEGGPKIDASLRPPIRALAVVNTVSADLKLEIAYSMASADSSRRVRYRITEIGMSSGHITPQGNPRE